MHLGLAAAVNTLLSKPENAAIAKQFYQQKIEHDFYRMCRIGRDFYRQELRWPDHPFWQQRGHWPDKEPAHPIPDSKISIAKRPVQKDGFIQTQEVIITTDHPRGLWQVAGIELVCLLRYLQQFTDDSVSLTHRVQRYAEQHVLDFENCQMATAWLTSRGLIYPEP